VEKAKAIFDYVPRFSAERQQAIRDCEKARTELDKAQLAISEARAAKRELDQLKVRREKSQMLFAQALQRNRAANEERYSSIQELHAEEIHALIAAYEEPADDQSDTE
jgi:regulator of replication initiation timing